MDGLMGPRENLSALTCHGPFLHSPHPVTQLQGWWPPSPLNECNLGPFVRPPLPPDDETELAVDEWRVRPESLVALGLSGSH